MSHTLSLIQRQNIAANVRATSIARGRIKVTNIIDDAKLSYAAVISLLNPASVYQPTVLTLEKLARYTGLTIEQMLNSDLSVGIIDRAKPVAATAASEQAKTIAELASVMAEMPKVDLKISQGKNSMSAKIEAGMFEFNHGGLLGETITGPVAFLDGKGVSLRVGDIVVTLQHAPEVK